MLTDYILPSRLEGVTCGRSLYWRLQCPLVSISNINLFLTLTFPAVMPLYCRGKNYPQTHLMYTFIFTGELFPFSEGHMTSIFKVFLCFTLGSVYLMYGKFHEKISIIGVDEMNKVLVNLTSFFQSYMMFFLIYFINNLRDNNQVYFLLYLPMFIPCQQLNNYMLFLCCIMQQVQSPQKQVIDSDTQTVIRARIQSNTKHKY